jgi:aspartyl/asparaginyl-tRNA synthetase
MKDTRAYHEAVCRLRAFFAARGYVEVPVQPRLSILAACEDPDTISMFEFSGEEWPLPQTGQMWLERELLENPEWPGVFCVSTSYRNEPNPIPGRHDLIFPMFEFESKGDVNDLIELEKDLLEKIEFSPPVILEYEDVCATYGVDEIGVDEETALQRDYGDEVIIKKFPFRSHPFWNMYELPDGLFNKVDVILHGIETVGSAQRSCDADGMRKNFYAVSAGRYAEKLFELFGEDRVLSELDDYLSLDMFPRFGGGIGLTRLARAMNIVGEVTGVPAAYSHIA